MNVESNDYDGILISQDTKELVNPIVSNPVGQDSFYMETLGRVDLVPELAQRYNMFPLGFEGNTYAYMLTPRAEDTLRSGQTANTAIGTIRQESGKSLMNDLGADGMCVIEFTLNQKKGDKRALVHSHSDACKEAVRVGVDDSVTTVHGSGDLRRSIFLSRDRVAFLLMV